MKGLLVVPEMALAILRVDDPKTVTRRVISPQPPGREFTRVKEYAESRGLNGKFKDQDYWMRCDYVAGEIRCMLTTWAVCAAIDDVKPSAIWSTEEEPISDMAPGFWHAGMGPKPDWCGKSRPGRFLPNHLRSLMPFVEIVSVEGMQVQSITEADAKAEGLTLVDGNIRRNDGLDYVSEFASLWDRINFRRGYGWSTNPWVWRVEFKRFGA